MKKTQGKAEKRITYRMLPKSLSALRAGAAEAETDLPESEELDDGEEERKAAQRKTQRASAMSIVVGAAFEAAVSKETRRRLAHGRALAVTVVVPTAAWVTPVSAYVRSVFGTRWCFHTRDGADRRRDASVGSDEAARDLSKGLCVMGVAVDEKLLPTALQSAADIVVRIPAPDGAVLRRAIARFARRSPGELDAGIAAGLDLSEIVAAFRPAKGAKDIARRLETARRSHAGPTERVPDLADAVEFGEARVWALNLARDVAEFKESKLEWRHLDRGIVLYSKFPGLGKSTFARMVSNACDAPLVSTSAGEWFNNGPGYLHTIVQQFRSAVSKARALAAPIAFLAIEEVDAAVPNRSAMSDRNDQFFNVVVSDILATLDSTLASDSRIIILASTNAVDRVDPALLRPGRLERVVEVPLPDAAGAVNILRFHLDGEIAEDLSPLGPLLAGSTGAEIMYMVRGARRAARLAGRDLAVADLIAAAMPPEEHPPARLFRMAIHESAHAVIVLALSAGTVAHVFLRSAGGNGGRTSVLYSDDDLTTRQAIEDRVTVALAARAAERLFAGSVSTGGGGAPDSDIGFSTIQIASLHASFGMRGAPVYLGAGEELLRAVAFDPALREAVGRDLRRLERRAERLVAANRRAILAVAGRLAERRHLDGAEVESIVRGLLVADPGPGGRAATARRPRTNP